MEFNDKVRRLLQHMYDNGGREYKSFRFTSIQDFQIANAINAAEFEVILEHAGEQGWLKWFRKDRISGARNVYHDVQLTPLGIDKVLQESPGLFDDISICPLTGVPIKGRDVFTPHNGSSAEALYTFKPIGKAVFGRNHLLNLARTMQAGNHTFRPDLAGFCRQEAEQGRGPVFLTPEMFASARNYPKTGAEKRSHFLKFLYEEGGKDYIERDLSIYNDFPLAFAADPKEFSRLIKSLLNAELIKFNKPRDSDNDWPFGIRTDYYGVLLTREGRKEAEQLSISPDSVAPPRSSAAKLADPKAALVSTKMNRVFVSHASKDVKYVEELIDLLKLIGLKKNQIFCTSVRGYGIPLGANFLTEIKERISDEVLVLFLFSPNFYASPVCLAEMGAAWVLSKEHVPIVIPPFGFGDIKGVLPHTQGMILNDGLHINELAQKVELLFGLGSHTSNDDWERSRERITERINHSIAQDAAAQAAAEAQSKAKGPGGGFNLA